MVERKFLNSLPMQQMQNIQTGGMPCVSIQSTTLGNTCTFFTNAALPKCVSPKGARPSQQPTSSRQLSVKSVDAAFHGCLLASTTRNPYSPLRKQDQLWTVLEPTLVIPNSVDIKEDDLAIMVHDYIENGIHDCDDQKTMDASTGTLAADSKQHNILQDLFSHALPHEEDLFSIVSSTIFSAKEKDLAVCISKENCGGRCIREHVMERLQLLNYDAALCTSKWLAHDKMPGGEYEYIDVFVRRGPGLTDRFIVDIDFRSQFEIARPTEAYLTTLRTLPVVFIGTTEKLMQVLQIMAEASKLSLRYNAMHVPPWRTFSYMALKWLSPFERQTQKSNNICSNSFGSRTHKRSLEQCMQQLCHLKLCLSSNATDKVQT